MMKKITFLFTMLFLTAFSWQGMAQLTEDFEVDPPTGWTFQQTETDDPGFVITTSQAHGGNSSFYHNDDNLAAESTSYMISPAYTVQAGDELSFWYYQNYSTSYYVYNGAWISTASNDPISNPGDFTELIEFGSGGSEGTWTEFRLALDTYVGQQVYIAFKYTGDYADEIYIDDFSIQVPPSCPDPSNLTTTNITDTEAYFDWTENGSATTWNIEYKAGADFTPGNGEQDMTASVGAHPYGFAAFQPSTTYYWYVQADCGGGDTSTWVGPQSFTTLATPPANDDCSNAVVLSCDDSLTGQTTLGATGGSSTSCQGSIGDDVWYSFEGNDNEVTITVNSTTSGEEAQVDVYASTDGTCAGFTPGTCDSSLVQSGGGDNPYSATFIANSGTTYFIAVGNWIDGNAGFNFDLTVSCVSCIPPSDLTNTGITTVYANFDWTENGSATAWNVEVKAGADFTPGNGEADHTTTSTAHPFGFGFDLTPNTTYYWYVRSDCGGGDTSTWVGPQSFTTLSDAVLDWYNIQWLSDGANGSNSSLTVEVNTTVTGYAQAYEAGVTDAAGQGAGIECWIGGNDTNTDPSTWPEGNWTPATFNADSGNNDEYMMSKIMDEPGTYYIAARWRIDGGVFTYGGFNGPWDGTTNNSIEVVVNPLANDECTGAEPLTVNSDLACGTVTSGTTLGASESTTDDTACNGTNNDDVWFSFVATADVHQISISNVVAVSGTSTDMYFEVLEGTCGALNSLLCSDPNTNSVSGLTIGDTYLIRVYSYYTSSSQTFDICVGTPPPPPTGSFCDDPILIASLPYTTTDDTANYGDYYENGSSPCTNYYMSGDEVFYTFTPTDDMTVDFTLSNLSDTYSAIHVLDNCPGSSPNCVAFEGNSGSSDRILDNVALSAGTTYYIIISTWASPQSVAYTLTIDDVVLGIANQSIAGFDMYPNPVTDMLNLTAQDTIDSVRIYNMLGQEVLHNTPSATQVQLDMNTLPTGAYIVKVQVGNQLGSYNLIKQ